MPPSPTSPFATFPIHGLAHALEHDNHERRKAMRELLQDPLFIPRHDVSLRYERELALERLRRIAQGGHISVLDFERNPLNILAAHEVAGMVDGSFTTKMTVQFNLFGGTVVKLGTERHRHLLEKIGRGGGGGSLCVCVCVFRSLAAHSLLTPHARHGTPPHTPADALQAVGCFGLTELGYGNNAVEMETTATYDHATAEWIIHTPSVLASKYWITNGGGGGGSLAPFSPYPPTHARPRTHRPPNYTHTHTHTHTHRLHARPVDPRVCADLCARQARGHPRFPGAHAP
jgi:acyl-CoA oxidase